MTKHTRIPLLARLLPPLLWVIALYMTEKAEMAIPLITAALLHETGHIVLLLLCGRSDFSLSPAPFGLKMRILPLSTYTAEVAVALGGPLFNLMTVGGMLLLPAGNAHPLFLASLLYAAVNLLPLGSLDGRRILFYLLCHRFLPDTAYRATRAIARGLSLLLWLYAAVLLLRYQSGVYLFCLSSFLLLDSEKGHGL